MNLVNPVTLCCTQKNADDITFYVQPEFDWLLVEMDLIGGPWVQQVMIDRKDATALRDWLNEVLA